MVWFIGLALAGLVAGIMVSLRWPRLLIFGAALAALAASFWFSASTDQMQWMVPFYAACIGLVAGLSGPIFVRGNRLIAIGLSVLVGVLLFCAGIYALFTYGCMLSGQCI